MRHTPEVLLLDDGELQPVAQLLDEMDIPFTRQVGADAGDETAPPLDLVIATPERAASVRRGSPADAARDRPIRIIAASEDSGAMRRRMKRLGFQLLVRLPAHQDMWQMLIERALPASDSDPMDTPTPQSSAVSVTTGRSAQQATLRDLANRGCRLHSRQEFCAGARCDFELGTGSGSPRPTLSGRLVRVHGELDSEGRPIHSAAMLFDEDLSSTIRRQISEMTNTLSSGGLCFAQPMATPIPACVCKTNPDLTLDDETDPLIRAEIPISLRFKPETRVAKAQSGRMESERRVHQRGAFPKRILAKTSSSEWVLMGRNISAGGMLIEHSPGLSEGGSFRLAIYGPAKMDPIIVSARVARDDGPAGMALSFEDVSNATSEKLEKLVAHLPQVQSLEDSETNELGAVISRILAEV